MMELAAETLAHWREEARYAPAPYRGRMIALFQVLDTMERTVEVLRTELDHIHSPDGPSAGGGRLSTPVIGGVDEEEYLYVGSGDRVVMLCDHHTPKWRNGIGLTPQAARKLAGDLILMADQSENVTSDE